ncbi:MAG: ABC transporter substrate-binding protein [Gammaproteobacteria bacterium]
MRKTRWNGIAAVVVSASLLAVSVLPARSQSTHTNNLIAGAKKEGKLTWYTAMSIRDSKSILETFAKKYPFVKTELVRATGERLINRITTETLAGKWLFDVVSTNGLAVMESKLLAYVSPEAGAYGKQFKDPESRWTGYDHNYYVLTYNTDKVTAQEVPKGYSDLLDPKWKGKIVIDPEDYEWYGTLVLAWGRQKTDKYMKQLAAQNIQWRRGHGLIAQVLGAGEFPLGIPYANEIEKLKKKGAPVEWVDTLDPIVTGLNAIGIGAKSSNPNTAKLFIDFILSKEGQGIIRDRERLPAREDIKPLSLKADPAKLKLQQVPREVYSDIAKYAEQFRKIFGL